MGDPATINLSEEYSRAVELAYQQETSQLYPLVRHVEQAAEEDYFNYVGLIDFHPVTTKHGKTILEEPDHTRRRVCVDRYARGVPLDDKDDMESVTDLGGPYMQGIYAGAGRLVDETIYAAFGAVAYSGKHGENSVNVYDAGESRLMNGDGTLVTAGSNFADTTETALTCAKLDTLNKLFLNAHVPNTGRYLLINEYNKNQLMTDAALSTDEKVILRNIKEDEVPRVKGWNLVVMADDTFTTNATDTGCIECYAWQRDAICFSRGRGRLMPQVRVGDRPDMNYDRQFFAQMYIGGARLRGPGVAKILLDKE
jgi:hypothetical protein